MTRRADERDSREEETRQETLGTLVLDDPPQVDLWVNDILAEPGKTYRYRMRVAVTNPLYNRDALPPEQREEHEDQFVLFSDWGNWSRPLSVERLEHFFVLNSSPNPAPGEVRIEVWRYFDGMWENEEFRAQPGDPIGEPTTYTLDNGEDFEVDFTTGDYVVDLDFDFPIPSDSGGSTRTTTRLLYMQDGQILSRRLDEDRNNEKREWLETQQEYSSLTSAF